MVFIETKLAGAYIIDLERREDSRGFFARAFCQKEFEAHGLKPIIAQANLAHNIKKGTLRGMHFQLPPADHAKLVYCISGAIFDMALDLRVGSPTYGEHEAYELSAEYNNAAYLPRGIAHGFFVRSAPAVVVYQVTSEHSPTHDTGIRWDSFSAKWPQSAPVVSRRDEGLTPFQQFNSPFQFDPALVVGRKQK